MESSLQCGQPESPPRSWEVWRQPCKWLSRDHLPWATPQMAPSTLGEIFTMNAFSLMFSICYAINSQALDAAGCTDCSRNNRTVSAAAMRGGGWYTHRARGPAMGRNEQNNMPGRLAGGAEYLGDWDAGEMWTRPLVKLCWRAMCRDVRMHLVNMGGGRVQELGKMVEFMIGCQQATSFCGFTLSSTIGFKYQLILSLVTLDKVHALPGPQISSLKSEGVFGLYIL